MAAPTLADALRAQLKDYSRKPHNYLDSFPVYQVEETLLTKRKYILSPLDLSSREADERFILDPVEGTYKDIHFYGGLVELLVTPGKPRWKTEALIIAADYRPQGKSRLGVNLVAITEDALALAQYTQGEQVLAMNYVNLFEGEVYLPPKQGTKRLVGKFVNPLYFLMPEPAHDQLLAITGLGVRTHARWLKMLTPPKPKK